MTNHHRQRGFTLVELGVVLGVVAVLALVLISARFFIESAKIGGAVQAVNSVRQASRAYAKRANAGVDFNGVTIPAMQSAQFNLLPNPMCGPWCVACPAAGACGVGVAAAPPANTNIQVGVCVAAGESANDLQAALARVGAVAPGGPCGGCPGGTVCMGVTTR